MKKRQAQEISDKIVAILREERIKKGITQYKMAKETGMSKSSILYIENCTQRPTLYTALLLADYLNMDLAKVIQEAIK